MQSSKSSGRTEKLNGNDTVASEWGAPIAHTQQQQNHLLHPGIGLTIEHLLSAWLTRLLQLLFVVAVDTVIILTLYANRGRT